MNGPVWQGYLAGSSKMAPRILILLIVMGADSLSKLESMPTRVLAFYAHNNLFLGKGDLLKPRSKQGTP